MASNPVMDIQMAIRRNAEDLRDELSALDKWEEEIVAKEAKLKAKPFVEADLPPVRGTAPLSASKKPKEDPILVAKDQGNEYFKQGKHEDAVRCYTKGINCDPNSSSMHILYGNRAMCYLKLQMWDLAEKDASTCIQMNRTYVKGFFRRALARKAMGKLKDAREDLQTLLVLSPGDKDGETELKSVTALLQAQAKDGQPSSSGAAAPKKKKLVIEEVEDEDDEPSPASASKQEAEKAAKLQQEREAQQERDREAARQAEITRAAERRKKAEAEEERLKAKRRINSRVEEIPDDEPATPEPQQQTRAPAAKHQDPIVPRKIVVDLSKDALVAPKSFLEFEQQHGDIKKRAPLLFGYYLTLIPAGKWSTIFGSSMNHEILADIFKAAEAAEVAAAVTILTGVATLPRIDEVFLFMDDDDREAGKRAVARAIAAGAKSKELDSLKAKF